MTGRRTTKSRGDPIGWDSLTDEWKAVLLKQAEAALTAAYPGRMPDTPETGAFVHTSYLVAKRRKPA